MTDNVHYKLMNSGTYIYIPKGIILHNLFTIKKIKKGKTIKYDHIILSVYCDSIVHQLVFAQNTNDIRLSHDSDVNILIDLLRWDDISETIISEIGILPLLDK